MSGERLRLVTCEVFSGAFRPYRRFTWIETGTDPGGRLRRQARARATERDWEFTELGGDGGFLERLVEGPWSDAEFLVVAPGERVRASWDGEIVATEPDAPGDAPPR